MQDGFMTNNPHHVLLKLEVSHVYDFCEFYVFSMIVTDKEPKITLNFSDIESNAAKMKKWLADTKETAKFAMYNLLAVAKEFRGDPSTPMTHMLFPKLLEDWVGKFLDKHEGLYDYYMHLEQLNGRNEQVELPGVLENCIQMLKIIKEIREKKVEIAILGKLEEKFTVDEYEVWAMLGLASVSVKVHSNKKERADQLARDALHLLDQLPRRDMIECLYAKYGQFLLSQRYRTEALRFCNAMLDRHKKMCFYRVQWLANKAEVLRNCLKVKEAIKCHEIVLNNLKQVQKERGQSRDKWEYEHCGNLAICFMLDKNVKNAQKYARRAWKVSTKGGSSTNMMFNTSDLHHLPILLPMIVQMKSAKSCKNFRKMYENQCMEEEQEFSGAVPRGKRFRKNLKKNRACHVCGKETIRLSSCARCESVYYCGVECQKKHWPEHKQHCKKIKKKQKNKKENAV